MTRPTIKGLQAEVNRLKDELSRVNTQLDIERARADLDRKLAIRGAPFTHVQAPDGDYYNANSAEDAFYIRSGRPDLAGGRY